MRMIEVNILNTIKTIDQSSKNEPQKYFCVSTDKAANPVNMMGASKRIMEMFLMEKAPRSKYLLRVLPMWHSQMDLCFMDSTKGLKRDSPLLRLQTSKDIS